jgi:hypothetical protein
MLSYEQLWTKEPQLQPPLWPLVQEAVGDAELRAGLQLALARERAATYVAGQADKIHEAAKAAAATGRSGEFARDWHPGMLRVLRGALQSMNDVALQTACNLLVDQEYRSRLKAALDAGEGPREPNG